MPQRRLWIFISIGILLVILLMGLLLVSQSILYSPIPPSATSTPLLTATLLKTTVPPTFTPSHTATAESISAIMQTATTLAELLAPNQTQIALEQTQNAGGVEPSDDELTLVAQLTATAEAAPLETDDPRITAQAVITQTREFLPETPSDVAESFCGDAVCLPDEIGICAADCVGATYTPVPVITITPTPTNTPGNNLPDSGGGGFAGIGSSSLYVFHDKTVRPKQQTIVELKLFFDAVFITATPTSARTAIPVTQSVPRPNVDADATSTPRSAVYSESEFEVPDKLIAILECGSAFVDCGAKPMLPLSITRPNEWLWQITPAEGVQGKQTLTLELWMAGEGDAPYVRIWFYDFAIEVLPEVAQADTTSSSVPLVVTIAGIAGLALVGGILFARRQPAHKKKIGVSLTNAPRVFISYRRSASAGYGQILHDKLSERGAEIFLDVRDLHAGEFGEDLKESIATCDYFLLLLAPTTLESQWVIKEVEYAREKGKIIIPVLINEFNLYGDDMPASLKWLQQQNAIPMPHLFVDAAIDKIAEFIGLPEAT